MKGSILEKEGLNYLQVVINRSNWLENDLKDLNLRAFSFYCVDIESSPTYQVGIVEDIDLLVSSFNFSSVVVESEQGYFKLLKDWSAIPNLIEIDMVTSNCMEDDWLVNLDQIQDNVITFSLPIYDMDIFMLNSNQKKFRLYYLTKSVDGKTLIAKSNFIKLKINR